MRPPPLGIPIEFRDGTILFVAYTPRAEIDEHPIPTFPGLNLGRKIGPTVTFLETEMKGIENLRLCCCLSVCFFCSRQQPVIFLEETGTFPQ